MSWRAKTVVLASVGALALGLDADADVFKPSEQRAIIASGLPRAAVVSVKQDLVVAVKSRGTSSKAGVVEGVMLQGEVVSTRGEQVFGYRSMRSTVNIDCGRRRDLVVKMVVFTEPRGRGEAIVRQTPGGWVQPSPDAYLADVVRAICPGGPPRPQVVAETPSTTALARAARNADADAPVGTSPEARSARVASMADTPALRPALGLAASDAAPPAAAAPAAAPGPPGPITAQIAASPSDAQARAALAKLAGSTLPPLRGEVRRVTVGGRVYHRALITGFSDRLAAQRFCAAVKVECFVR